MSVSLLFLKIISSVAIVLGLSLAAERASPRVAGLLAGLPLGGAIVLFFFGIEQGVEFAAASAVYATAGLSALLVFVAAYWFFSARLTRWNLAFTAPLSILAFILASFLLSLVSFQWWSAVLLTCLCCFLAIRLFRAIPPVKILKPVSLTPRILMLRSAVAGGIVVLVTGLAEVLGPNWSGLLAGFPFTLFPLMLIVHWSYSPVEVHAIIRAFPTGMGSLIIYMLAVSATYPLLGIGMGTIVALSISGLYAAGLAFMVKAR